MILESNEYETESNYKMSYNKERNFRCSCCNQVSSDDIASDPFEYNPRLYFSSDPRDPSRLYCSECVGQIAELLRDFREEEIEFDFEDM